MARPSRQPAPCLQAADSLTGRPNLLPGRPAWHLQVRCFRARRPLCTLLDPARQVARVGRQCGLGCNGGLCEYRGEPKDSKELGEEEGRNSLTNPRAESRVSMAAIQESTRKQSEGSHGISQDGAAYHMQMPQIGATRRPVAVGRHTGKCCTSGFPSSPRTGGVLTGHTMFPGEVGRDGGCAGSCHEYCNPRQA